jgi:hypothetical protein
VSPDFDRIVALQVDPANRTVAVGDTLRLEAQALNAAGEAVADADVFWAIVDVDTGQIGFTLDSVTGLVSAHDIGEGRVQARVENIRSNPITISVVGGQAASRRWRGPLVYAYRRRP